MRYFSMFSGIGGFELGIQRAFDNQYEGGGNTTLQQMESNPTGKLVQGATACIGYSEIDKYAIKVYERQFNGDSSTRGLAEERSSNDKPQSSPDRSDGQRGRSHTNNNESRGHTNYGDATKFNTKDLPDFELLVGGFPCQAFSVAGKRGGFNDTRGTLFFDIARVLKDKRPRHLLLENVKGLLSHDKGKTFQTIIGVLADLGYRVEWQVLNSKDFGVPQNRERVFIIGHLRGECGRQVFPITNSYRQNIETVQRHISNTLTARYEGAQATGTYIGESEFNAQALTETRTDEAKRIRRESQKQGKDWSPRRAKVLRPRNDGVGNTVTAAQSKEHLLKTGAKIRRLTPKECERLQGFPDDWTRLGKNEFSKYPERISDTQRYKMCGNAVTVNVVEAVISNFNCLREQNND